MSNDQQVDAALDLLRRLPPAETDANLDRIVRLAPHLQDELLESVDVQLKTKRCTNTGRDFLCCDYNRDGDSYRSPWSNEFEPPIEDDDGGTKPSERLRAIEVRMGEAVDVYRDLYYEGGISSVYFWDLDDGFAGVVLIKKTTPKGKGDGVWDSIHVFEAIDRARTAHYKLTTTVILHLGSSSENLGQINLGGNMVYQKELDLPVEDDNSHIINLGRMIEDMETKHRGMLNEVYFGKARDIIGDLRSVAPLTQANADRAAQREMISEWSKGSKS